MTSNISAPNDSTPNDSKFNYSNSSFSNGATFSKHQALATPQHRLISFILDAVLFSITFGVGWIIWFLAIAVRGTTPGHDLMGQKIVDHRTGRPLRLGRMLVREFLIKGIFTWLIASFTMCINYIVDGAFIFRDDRRTVHDLILGTDVIQDRNSELLKKLQSL